MSCNVSPAGSAKMTWRLDTYEQHVLVLSTCLKLLLFPAYRSTDFDVHRNWLRITNDLPLSQWYHDSLSEWTLDYPPFFAFFERALSIVAFQIHPSIASLSEVTPAAVIFQRGSVIISELVLVAATLRYTGSLRKQNAGAHLALMAAIVAHPAFLMVDHIHFQYNGMLFGILIFSLCAAKREQYPLCAALFAVLLNFKHIFMYISLPYLFFLLRVHCIEDGRLLLSRIVQLGSVVLGITSLSFGPFLVAGGVDGLKQIFSRLFPFQRGLNHAYWAPNVWALLTTADRALMSLYIKSGHPVDPLALSASSRGLVGDTHFGVVPQVTPKICFALTIASNLVVLAKLWAKPTHPTFVKSIAFSAYASFLFGWHVHEKAALLFLVPLTLVAHESYAHYRTCLIASVSSIYALFPLLIHAEETPVKLSFTLLWTIMVCTALKATTKEPFLFASSMSLGAILHNLENAYLWSFAALWCATSPMTEMFKARGQEFMPLLLTSVYCAVGVVWSFGRFSWLFVTG